MKLIKINENRFVVRDKNMSFEGNYKDTMQFLEHVMKVDIQEIKDVFLEFKARGHNCADFGVDNLWTFTEKTYVTESPHNLIDELEAVYQVRQEFNAAYRKAPSGISTRETWNRLMGLYMQLNVAGMLKVLDVNAEKRKAS